MEGNQIIVFINLLAGISPAAILQKMQLLIALVSSARDGRLFINPGNALAPMQFRQHIVWSKAMPTK